jgi:hypothetical protein
MQQSVRPVASGAHPVAPEWFGGGCDQHPEMAQEWLQEPLLPVFPRTVEPILFVVEDASTFGIQIIKLAALQ